MSGGTIAGWVPSILVGAGALALMAADPGLAVLFVLTAPLFFGFALLAARLLRYRRFLTLWVVGTAVHYASLVLPLEPAQAIRIGIDLLFVAAILWPRQLHLAGPRGPEVEADRRLRAASSWFRAARNDRAEAKDLAASLWPATFPIGAGEWAVAATLFRVSLVGAGSGETGAPSSTKEFLQAAGSFWRAAREGHLLGRRFRPDSWDDGQALRAYLDECRLSYQPGATNEALPNPNGDQRDKLDALVEELTTIPLDDPVARQVRDAMVPVIRDELAIARVGSTKSAAELKSSAERLRTLFDALDVRARQAVERRNEIARRRQTGQLARVRRVLRS